MLDKGNFQEKKVIVFRLYLICSQDIQKGHIISVLSV